MLLLITQRRLGILLTGFCLAEEDYLTITTYYPSPHGSYNELQANKLAIGDTSGNNNLDIEDQPPENGQLYVARGVIYKPQSSLPLGVKEGELVYVYNSTTSEENFYYYSAKTKAWVKQGGDRDYYTKTGTNPSCGTDYLVGYYWQSKTCTGTAWCMSPTSCTTPGGWFGLGSSPAGCSYHFQSGGGNCVVYTCSATTWTKALCIRTD